jgi:hypothetical protein
MSQSFIVSTCADEVDLRGHRLQIGMSNNPSSVLLHRAPTLDLGQKKITPKLFKNLKLKKITKNI